MKMYRQILEKYFGKETIEKKFNISKIECVRFQIYDSNKSEFSDQNRHLIATTLDNHLSPGCLEALLETIEEIQIKEKIKNSWVRPAKLNEKTAIIGLEVKDEDKSLLRDLIWTSSVSIVKYHQKIKQAL